MNNFYFIVFCAKMSRFCCKLISIQWDFFSERRKYLSIYLLKYIKNQNFCFGRGKLFQERNHTNFDDVSMQYISRILFSSQFPTSGFLFVF